MPINEPVSAKNGTASFEGTSLGDVTNISITKTQQVNEYASSSTGGQITRTAGHQDVSGSFTMLVEPSFERGDEGNLLLKYNGTQVAYNGGAIITDIEETVAIGDGSNLEWVVNFGQKIDASSGFTSSPT